MKLVCTYETSISFYETTRYNDPEKLSSDLESFLSSPFSSTAHKNRLICLSTKIRCAKVGAPLHNLKTSAMLWSIRSCSGRLGGVVISVLATGPQRLRVQNPAKADYVLEDRSSMPVMGRRGHNVHTAP
jgi:hypothetical protein